MPFAYSGILFPDIWQIELVVEQCRVNRVQWAELLLLILLLQSCFFSRSVVYLFNKNIFFFHIVITMLIAGIAGLGMYFVKSSLQIVITACIFSLMLTTANIVLSSVAVDVFPTHISAVALCMMACLGRCGAVASNLAFGMLLDLSCEIPIFLLAAITICEYSKICQIHLRKIKTESQYIINISKNS